MPKLKIKKEQLAIFAVIAGIVIIYFFGMTSGTGIDRYRPKSQDESRIVDLLRQFQKAKKGYNLEGYLSCLSENGEFMFAGALMVSKKKLRQLLPSFWSDLNANLLDALPSSREELNGNYFNGGFYDPVIVVDGDRARAIVTFITPVSRWTTKLFLVFQKENENWKISRLEWDMG
ncbi:MAG: hypothetical protein HUN04_20520 [Desulfobacter sp.]|nr:MAG: hypothetical protein HUN04_20520 [Desulfobacter sp.]